MSNPSQRAEHTEGQWPDNITKGRLRYAAANNYEGFYLADASHGIPTLGAVTVRVFNYPAQTETIARRLVACWNYCVGMGIEELEDAHRGGEADPRSVG